MSNKSCNKCQVGQVGSDRPAAIQQVAAYLCANCRLKHNFIKGAPVHIINPPIKDDRATV